MSSRTHKLPAATIHLDGREVEFRVRHGGPETRRRLRVGLAGVEVVEPAGGDVATAQVFLEDHTDWVLAQLDRIDKLRQLRRDTNLPAGTIMFRGAPLRIDVERVHDRRGPTRISRQGNRLVVSQPWPVTKSAASSLERWLRRQARDEVMRSVERYADRLDVVPGRIYIMDQRTKWGNCSALGNLSFNWRIVMAPDMVLDYVVAHEVLHLAQPDHSPRFWLALQSVCPQSERARQWLVANADQLDVDLDDVVSADQASKNGRDTSS